MSTTLIEIPVIDFEPFIDGDVVAQQAVSRQIYQACHEIGFMYLKNPGIPPSLIERMFEQAKQFFALPLEIKNQVAWSSAFSNRGYVGVERERLDQDKPGDLKEAFNVGKEVDPKDISKQEQFSLILNQWPEGQDTFRKTVLEFYQACAEAAEKVCYAFASALQLPESFFADKHNQQNYTLRLLHYPPIEQTPKPEQVRAGEHSDYGSFTLLFQDEVGGLEVRTAAGEWIAAPCIRWYCCGQHRGFDAAVDESCVLLSREHQINTRVGNLIVGGSLPTVLLWLRGGLCLPVDMNTTYERTCREQRITVNSA